MPPLRRLVSLLLGALMLVGCAVPATDDDVTDKPDPNLVLEMKIKAALVAEPSLNAAAIEVTANNQAITLGGFVETQAQRQRAAEVARKVPGVREVISNITVK